MRSADLWLMEHDYHVRELAARAEQVRRMRSRADAHAHAHAHAHGEASVSTLAAPVLPPASHPRRPADGHTRRIGSGGTPLARLTARGRDAAGEARAGRGPGEPLCC